MAEWREKVDCGVERGRDGERTLGDGGVERERGWWSGERMGVMG